MLGVITFILSVNRKYTATNFTVWEIINVLMLIFVGYGSYVAWYAINGRDDLPEFKNIKWMAWEGFKKSCILFVYTAVLTFFIHHANSFYVDGNVLLAAICSFFFIGTYLILVGGLINRYLHEGSVLEAFNIPGIIGMFSAFDANTFVRVVISAAISHLCSLSVLLDFEPNFTQFELLFSIALFFLAPFLLIATKRLVGMHVHDLLEKNELDIKKKIR